MELKWDEFLRDVCNRLRVGVGSEEDVLLLAEFATGKIIKIEENVWFGPAAETSQFIQPNVT